MRQVCRVGRLKCITQPARARGQLGGGGRVQPEDSEHPSLHPWRGGFSAAERPWKSKKGNNREAGHLEKALAKREQAGQHGKRR